MAANFQFGTVKVSNITAIRNEINRLRNKHGLSSVSFPSTTDFALSSTMDDMKTKLSQLNQSPWIGSVNVSGITGINVGDIIKESNFTAFNTVINTVDAICAHNANYSNWSDDSDYSTNSDYRDDWNQSTQYAYGPECA